jgi:ADP-ribose pyrophosphatase
MNQHLREETVQTQRVFEGRMISLDVETVRLPNGKETTREVVRHPGAVAVLAITQDQTILFVRQYRKAIDKISLEIPAGKLEKGEDPLHAAKRELMEETGYQAGSWNHLHTFYTSPGFADEVMHVYVATDLQAGDTNLDEDEFLECVEADESQIQKWLADGTILDAKTIAPLYWWLWQREKGQQG